MELILWSNSAYSTYTQWEMHPLKLIFLDDNRTLQYTTLTSLHGKALIHNSILPYIFITDCSILYLNSLVLVSTIVKVIVFTLYKIFPLYTGRYLIIHSIWIKEEPC